MSTVDAAVVRAKELIAKHPKLRSDVKDLLEMMKDEIEFGGGSETHEAELCIDSLNELERSQ